MKSNGGRWKEWTIKEQIGQGSYGKVYKISKEDFGHTYEAALKLIDIPQSGAEIETLRSDGVDEKSIQTYFFSIVNEIVKEFELMSKLKGHTNIVSYEDHMVAMKGDGYGWQIGIRMELLTPLDTYIKTHPFYIRDVIKLGIDVCKALVLCQKQDIIHRDIKPLNIFVTEFGDFKLGDFGIARQLEKTSYAMSKKGTYDYMAPEVYKGNPYNSTADIYSLGIVMYRYLNNNRIPFLPAYPEPIMHSDKEKANLLRANGTAISPPCNASGKLVDIVLKACAYEPSDRYQKAEDMQRDLEKLVLLNQVGNSVSSSGSFSEKEKIFRKTETEVKSQSARPDTGGTMKVTAKDLPQSSEISSKHKTAAIISVSAVVLIVAVIFTIGLLSFGGEEYDYTNDDTEKEETVIEPEMDDIAENVSNDLPSEMTEEEKEELFQKAKDSNTYEHEPVQMYDGHVYAIFNIRKEGLNSFQETEQWCEERGGHLAVINSEEENEFIYQYVLDSGLKLAFFGYTDEKEEGVWEWVYGESDYTNWAEGQPNNGANNKSHKGENYAEFYRKNSDGTWNDAIFAVNTHRFICEWE